MQIASLRGWSALALPVLLGPAAACSSSPSGTSPVDPAQAPSAALSEEARVQQFLDARYLRSDVRDAFRTPAGQDIDCVDFFAEPGVKAMAARGEPIAAMPEAPPIPDAILAKRAAERGRASRVQDISFHGQPDANGKPQRCPEGTVPEVRITAEEIQRAGGLDAYLRARAPRVPPTRHASSPTGAAGPTTPFVCDPTTEYANYAHVIGTLVNGDHPVGYGDSTMAVYGPNVPPVQDDHSLSQIWLYSGANTAVGGGSCTSDCVQSVEVGWDIDNWVNPGDTSTPHIFLFSTNDGYAHTGCYNDVPNPWYSCVPWVPAANAQYALNQALSFTPPANTGGAQPTELETTIIEIGGNYWVLLSVTGGPSSYIGYFPGSDFSKPMDMFQVGGEVYDSTGKFMNSGVEMGSGQPPADGFGWAAYHRNYAAAWTDSSGQTQWTFDASVCAMRPADYGFSTSGAGQTTWDQFFYYGGNPTCTVTTCQARGATCGTIDDGCGTPLECGTCGAGDECDGNTCVCAPKPCRTGWSWNYDDCMCEKNVVCKGTTCQ